MLPTRMEAERLLEEAEKYNPGPWGDKKCYLNSVQNVDMSFKI